MWIGGIGVILSLLFMVTVCGFLEQNEDNFNAQYNPFCHILHTEQGLPQPNCSQGVNYISNPYYSPLSWISAAIFLLLILVSSLMLSTDNINVFVPSCRSNVYRINRNNFTSFWFFKIPLPPSLIALKDELLRILQDPILRSALPYNTIFTHKFFEQWQALFKHAKFFAPPPKPPQALLEIVVEPSHAQSGYGSFGSHPRQDQPPQPRSSIEMEAFKRKE